MKNFFPATLIGVILTFSFSLSAAPAKSTAKAKAPPAPARPTSVDGTYEGNMVMRDTRVKVPIAFSLQLTEDELPTNADEPFSKKKGIAGSFIVDGEAGPYSLATSDFEVNRGVFNLKYNRSSGAPSLRFQCGRKLDGSCSGTVISQISSSLGVIADFAIHKVSKSNIAVTPKYVGVWKGKLKFSEMAKVIRKQTPTMPGAPQFGDEESFTFTLASADENGILNPPTFELDFSPTRLGSFWYDKTPASPLPFTLVQIDYLHRKMYLVSKIVLSGNQTMQFTLKGTFDEDGTFANGVVTSTNFGDTGTFTAEKVQ